jgi:putative mRNA 3-end processing factor
MALLEFSERGLYCKQAGVFIDPSNSVPRALITHAHGDHAAAGCQSYLCTPLTAQVLKYRHGRQSGVHTAEFGEETRINGVKFSFHPAAHIVGSAQIRVEYQGEVWVVSGDYKTEHDGLSEPYESVRCHTFVTESTFGLPVYNWEDQAAVFSEINAWWGSNAAQGITSVISAYALGKAQRIIHNVDHNIGPVYCHGAVENINKVLRAAGVVVKHTQVLDERVRPQDTKNALVITPGSTLNTAWIKRFKAHSTASASGWMTLRGRKKWQHVDRGFVLSDHADWKGLNAAVESTGCERVIVTHGYTDSYARWLRELGYWAQPEKTAYEGETG